MLGFVCYLVEDLWVSVVSGQKVLSFCDLKLHVGPMFCRSESQGRIQDFWKRGS